MNDSSAVTSAPGASLLPGTTGTFTALHLAVIAIFALLVVIAIIWGVRLKSQRRQADRTLHEHNALVEDRAATTPPAPAPPAAAPPAPAAPTATPRVAPIPEPERIAETPAAAAPVAAIPAAVAPIAPIVAAPVAAAPAAADAPVTQLKGLGPKVAARLGELGITTVGQLAALGAGEAADLDARLGAFQGRMSRDRWIEQARFLAAGDRAGFEAVFGKL
jgi:predicted flap endonuclease-1-like 5' DNA nuclease